MEITFVFAKHLGKTVWFARTVVDGVLCCGKGRNRYEAETELKSYLEKLNSDPHFLSLRHV